MTESMSLGSETIAQTISQCGDAGPKKQRYHIERVRGGFSIEAKDRCPVRLTLEKGAFALQSEDKTYRCGFFAYRKMIRWITEAVLRRWPSSKGPDAPGGAPRWLMEATGRALNARIHPLWRELLAQADQQVVAVQRRMFANTFDVGPVALTEELYRHPYIVADILKYRAAVIAATYVNNMAYDVPWILERYPYAAQRRQSYDQWRSGRYGLVSEMPLEAKGTEAENISLWMDLMGDWRALFSPTGQTYTSLNKTLTAVPGRVTPGLLRNLHGVMLRRPVLDRLELMVIGAAVECRNRHHDPVFAHAQRAEIVQAMRVLGEAYGQEVGIRNPGVIDRLSPLRTDDIVCFTRYLSDFPELHKGRILGLTRKAIRWHQDQVAGEYRQTLESLGLSRQTAMPPIPLPNVDGINFLSTVGEIGEEAARMKHCVASYARSAVQGDCYLFHVDHGGDMATVEVSRGGRVLQSRGPQNVQNRAAFYGQQVLNEWGEGFPATPAETAIEDFPF